MIERYLLIAWKIRTGVLSFRFYVLLIHISGQTFFTYGMKTKITINKLFNLTHCESFITLWTYGRILFWFHPVLRLILVLKQLVHKIHLILLFYRRALVHFWLITFVVTGLIFFLGQYPIKCRNALILFLCWWVLFDKIHSFCIVTLLFFVIDDWLFLLNTWLNAILEFLFDRVWWRIIVSIF